ncbi:MAG TPA: TRAP transporter large permease subunit [Candidatus Limnocylindrales bacterium]|nr:TRAP transporter large permease subunit [Candidatus Limnocylindrales bacterium]
MASLALAAMVVLPLAEIVLRRLFGVGIPGSIPFVQHLTLWIAFLGAALAARDGKLLALATGTFLPEGPVRRAADVFAAAVGAAVSAVLCRAALALVMGEYEFGTEIAGGVKAWMAQIVLPLGFGAVAARLVWRASPGWGGRAVAALGALAGTAVAIRPEVLEGLSAWPGLVVILAGAALGSPIFSVLGGAAALLFMVEGIRPVAILISTYELSVNPTLPSIPLFTLAGFLLAEGRTPARLLRVFRALFGWMPGSTAIVCTVVSAFFTVFTGGSGVTILALGGLLLPALLQDGYRERFSIGLLTAAGSLGLLLPPALPLILYGIVSETPIEDLFIGGIVPGLLLIALVAAWGVREGLKVARPRAPFDAKEALAAVWDAKWALMLPVVVLGALFSGAATIVESAALAALYAFIVQIGLNRELSLVGDVRRVFSSCVATVGGVLIILGVAVGLTAYLVDAQVPSRLVEAAPQYIKSPFVFLLALNIFLLIVGMMMDIFSATFVVVPLIVPLGAAFGIHPVHLGVIFIANLELGYLTPPVGLNLFLASYRFEKPLLEVSAAVLPMLAIRTLGVLLVTYVPWLTTGLLTFMGR